MKFLFILINSIVLIVSSAFAEEISGFEIKPRISVIVDNDFGGDPDGLFQLAHQLLSKSTRVVGVIASQHYTNGFYGSSGEVAYSKSCAQDLLNVMGLDEKVRLVAGNSIGIQIGQIENHSESANMILAEAMKCEPDKPLYILCGAGLTNIANALLVNPEIASRIRLVWIGGGEYEGLSFPPPGAHGIEYNLGIDLRAAQVVFSNQRLSIWQINRTAYRLALVSITELRARLDKTNRLNQFLLGRLSDLFKRAKGTLGESYVLGDSPLVLCSALQSSWERDTCSSTYCFRTVSTISGTGIYELREDARAVRVFTTLDMRLLFEDMYSKFNRFTSK